MKIVIYDNFVCSPMAGRGAAGGLEKVAKDDAFNMTRAGHEVIFLYAGLETQHQFPFRTVQVNSISKEEVIDGGGSVVAWQNVCVKNAINIIKSERPDVMLYHSHTTSPAKKIIAETGIPTLITLHGFLTGNLFIDTGRILSYRELLGMGAYIVTNTKATGERLKYQAESVRRFIKNADDYSEFINILDQGLPFYDDHFKNFMFVEEDYEIKASEGYAIIASRADPLKQVQKFGSINYPTKIFWKKFPSTSQKYPAWLDKQVEIFNSNKSIELNWDHPYAGIMDSFSRAKACIISWPDETFGLTAFEAAQKGVPSICLHKGQPNCTHEFLSRVQAPILIDYRDKNYLDQVVQAIGSIDDSIESRRNFATRFKDYYSFDNWLMEKMAFIQRAIDRMSSRPSQSKTLFDVWS